MSPFFDLFTNFYVITHSVKYEQQHVRLQHLILYIDGLHLSIRKLEMSPFFR